MTFYDLLEQVLALLQRHHCLSYRALKLQFPLLDPACSDALRDELLFQGVARDAEGQGLIWLGGPSVVPQATVSCQPAPAPANAVVISAVTARLVHGTFTLEDLGTHALPGVAEPMTISRVCGLLATPGHDEEFVTSGVPFLVGRAEEVGVLRRRWEQSKAGHGQVVLRSGEAGIGKSRLVQVLTEQVASEP